MGFTYKKYKELINSDELNKILEDGKNKTSEIARLKYEELKNKGKINGYDR